MSRPSLDAPIKRESVAELVAGRIMDLVRRGELKPGDQLPAERDLAQSLNVSRPSLREAIRGLSILGVVQTRQGGGAYISPLDAEALLGPIQFYLSLEDMNVAELYEARMLIESDVARRAAVHMTDPEIDALGRILKAQRDTLGDPDAFRASDFAFHMALWTGARNAFLKRIGESLNVIGLDFRRRASETHGVLEQSLKDHAALLEALRDRDADAAACAASAHMSNVYRSTIAQGGPP
jgi:DNA-binding FadR family transcriptional regulator